MIPLVSWFVHRNNLFGTLLTNSQGNYTLFSTLTVNRSTSEKNPMNH
jgi:hypothetical protein